MDHPKLLLAVRSLVAIGLLVAAGAMAAPTQGPRQGRPAKMARISRPATARQAPATAPAERKATASPPAARTAPTPAAPAAKEAPETKPRRLEDIHIEGEIPAPQVLFITARDQRRFMESRHHRYLRTSLQLGEATRPPAGIVLGAERTLTPEPPPAP